MPNVPKKRISSSTPRRQLPPLGSESNPFPSARHLFDFLLRDNPDCFVFRGQTQAYPGPLLPSGIRAHFIPFNTSESVPDKYAGITWPSSKIQQSYVNRHSEFENHFGHSRIKHPTKVDDSLAWETTETSFQDGFNVYFSQTASPRHPALGSLLKDGMNARLPPVASSSTLHVVNSEELKPFLSTTGTTVTKSLDDLQPFP